MTSRKVYSLILTKVPNLLPIGTKVRVAKEYIDATRKDVANRHKKIHKITVAWYEGYDLDD